MNHKPPLILASASPRRRAFLAMLDLPFSVHTADIDETPHPDEKPIDLVCRLSREKAAAVAHHYQDGLIIAADTIVVLDGLVLGKPADPTEARSILTRLRGRAHEVFSAISLLYCPSQEIKTYLNRTVVLMRSYTDPEIDDYIASGDPLDKAGAYAIQHPGFAPVAQISGCYAGVVGLPLGCLAEGLAQYGIILPNLADRCAAFTGHSCCQQPL
jgi:septum formation protein